MKSQMVNDYSGGLSIGLVIFTKNEERTIGEVLENVFDYINKNDIFVIDGYSNDDTVTIAQKSGIRLLIDPGKGKGSAVRLAINKIERDVLIFMDSDGSHRAEEIPFLLEPIIRDKEIDMVIGSRFMGGSEEFYTRPGEIIRVIGNVTSTFLVNLIYNVKLSDIQNGFRAVRRNALKKLALAEDSFAIEQEMVMKCLKNKKKIIEVPSFEAKRKHNKSHVKPLEMLPRYINSFFKELTTGKIIP